MLSLVFGFTERASVYMTKNLRFYPDIPEGMSIFFADEEVAGVQHRLSNVRAFASGRHHALRLEREPNNPHDPNAIKVIGIYKGWFFTHRVHIGYVPAEIAEEIAERNLFSQIQPLLKNIWWGGYVRDYIVVRFDILGPKPPKEPREAKSKVRRAKKKRTE
jgi:hypothetical protein